MEYIPSIVQCLLLQERFNILTVGYFEIYHKYLSANKIKVESEFEALLLGVHGPQSSLVSVLSKSKSSAVAAHVSHCVSPTNKQATFLLSKYFITFQSPVYASL